MKLRYLLVYYTRCTFGPLAVFLVISRFDTINGLFLFLFIHLIAVIWVRILNGGLTELDWLLIHGGVYKGQLVQAKNVDHILRCDDGQYDELPGEGSPAKIRRQLLALERG